MATTAADATYPSKTDARFKFIASEDRVSEARVLAEVTLISWALRYLVPDVRVIVSELLTNAIAATPNETVMLVLVREENAVFIGIWDSSPKRPVMGACNLEDESGRGLFLVASLADEHGLAVGMNSPEEPPYTAPTVGGCHVSVAPT